MLVICRQVWRKFWRRKIIKDTILSILAIRQCAGIFDFLPQTSFSTRCPIILAWWHPVSEHFLSIFTTDHFPRPILPKVWVLVTLAGLCRSYRLCCLHTWRRQGQGLRRGVPGPTSREGLGQAQQPDRKLKCWLQVHSYVSTGFGISSWKKGEKSILVGLYEWKKQQQKKVLR